MSGGYVDYCKECIEKMCTDQNKKIELEEKANESLSVNKNEFTKSHIYENRHKHDEHIYLLLPLEYTGVSHAYNQY